MATEARERALLAQYRPLPSDNCNENVPKRYLRVIVQNYYASYSSSMAPPRILWLERDTTVQQVHLEVFKAVRGLMEKYLKREGLWDMSVVDQYKHIFSEENRRNRKDASYSSYYSSYSNRLPYKLKIYNRLQDLYRRSENCFFCGKTYCQNCELPEGQEAYIPEEGGRNTPITLNHLLAQIPKRKGQELVTNCHHYIYDENKGGSSYYSTSYSSGSYYYGGRSKVKDFEASDNLDFELVIEWSRTNCQSIYDVDPSVMSYARRMDEPEVDNNPKNDLRDSDEEEKRIEKSAKRVSGQTAGSFTLEGCLQYFQQPEQLQPQNEWYCGRCKDHVLATKQVQVYRAPPILLIQFKRFKMTNQSRSSYYSSYYSFSSSGASEGEKITDLIHYPL